MKRILYLHPKSNPGTADENLKNRGYVLICARKYVDALEMLRSQNFDAVVIDDENESPKVVDFTIHAHCLRPDLPVFLTVDWGVELPMALESLGETKEFGQVGPADRVWSIFDGLPASLRL